MPPLRVGRTPLITVSGLTGYLPRQSAPGTQPPARPAFSCPQLSPPNMYRTHTYRFPPRLPIPAPLDPQEYTTSVTLAPV